MNEESSSNDILNDDFSMNTEDRDYKNLINRLKEIKSTIASLEKTIFK